MSDRPPVLDPALLERLIARALARGGDFADLFVESEVSFSLRWEEGAFVRVRSGASGEWGSA